jgi:hypothetical protein
VRKSTPTPRFSQRHIARRLRVLRGTWRVDGRFVGGDKPMDEHGTVTFRWLEKDALIVMRSSMKVQPKAVSVIGADDSFNTFTLLHSDERQVVRRCEMTLSARLWTWTRRAPGFHQRFIARISANGRRMDAKVEKSVNGRKWLRDFDLVYTKRR